MQFAWKRVHGDVAATAQIDFVGEKGNNYRKAALMLQGSLNPSALYAEVARHGDGLTSLQFRLTPGDVTREIETPVTAPHWLRIERRGDLISVAVGERVETLRFSGATMHLHLPEDVYVGLAVCSHDKDVTETAIFRHLQTTPLRPNPGPTKLWSTLETVKVASSDRRVAYTAPALLATPNWSKAGAAVTLEQAGEADSGIVGRCTPVQRNSARPRVLFGGVCQRDGHWYVRYKVNGKDVQINLPHHMPQTRQRFGTQGAAILRWVTSALSVFLRRQLPSIEATDVARGVVMNPFHRGELGDEDFGVPDLQLLDRQLGVAVRYKRWTKA